METKIISRIKKAFSNYDTIYHENLFIDKNNNIENFWTNINLKKT